ncbi:hypothetical protein AB0D12_31770 [Streptomyces sp. NPDC048479]|uniref:hypothetical protein n=1 Tax=Streptomyces sp. NPDC048479 TaxID=3154725 RepID=UPI00343D7C9B
MDQATAETHFARCYARWASATNFRRFRTAQQDEQQAKKQTKNRRKANLLEMAADFVIIVATLAAAVAMDRLMQQADNVLRVTGVVAIAFGVHGIVRGLVSAVIGGTQQRLHTAAGCTDCTGADTPETVR